MLTGSSASESACAAEESEKSAQASAAEVVVFIGRPCRRVENSGRIYETRSQKRKADCAIASRRARDSARPCGLGRAPEREHGVEPAERERIAERGAHRHFARGV